MTRWQPPAYMIRLGFVVSAAACGPIVYQIVWTDKPSDAVIRLSFIVVMLGLCPLGLRAYLQSQPRRLYAHVHDDLRKTLGPQARLRFVPDKTEAHDLHPGEAGWISEGQLTRHSHGGVGIGPEEVAFAEPTSDRMILLYCDGETHGLCAIQYGEGRYQTWATTDDDTIVVALHGCPALPAELLS
jgi:hypothetical protein